MIIDRAAIKDCYAPEWSYGEICVGCGCCSKDPFVRAAARLRYHEIQLEEEKNFSGWWYDDPQTLEIQKRNVAANIKYHEEGIKKYKAELEGLKRNEQPDA